MYMSAKGKANIFNIDFILGMYYKIIRYEYKKISIYCYNGKELNGI